MAATVSPDRGWDREPGETNADETLTRMLALNRERRSSGRAS
jgi:hypothetical protein